MLEIQRMHVEIIGIDKNFQNLHLTLHKAVNFNPKTVLNYTNAILSRW